MTDGRTAILHLGTYKTGSSAIQNFLYANRALLAERGLLYPQTGLIKSDEIGYRHRRLVEAVLKGEAGSYVPRPLRDELQQSPQPKVLFSAKSWSNPRQIPILGGFATELGDIGIARVEGVVFLRRLIDYKISHYREFTTRHGNRKPFHDYVRQAPGMFDYLFLIRNFRAIFGARLRVLDYARTDNSITALFDGLGWSGLLAGLETDTRANLRPLGALEVEIIRQASLAGLPRPARRSWSRMSARPIPISSRRPGPSARPPRVSSTAPVTAGNWPGCWAGPPTMSTGCSRTVPRRASRSPPPLPTWPPRSRTGWPIIRAEPRAGQVRAAGEGTACP